jgi:CheY-like chemotaxis protein/HPt (histidine-containing phosphotransfer) domain-containing protein
LLECLKAVVGVSKAGPKSHERLLITKHTISEASFKHCRVLVAEDNPVNQKVAFNILKKAGYSTDIVSTGRQAVDRVSNGGFDIVLMDCQMPELDGLEATKEIRGLDSPAARIPIIAMTAHAMPGDRQRCMDAGMDGYVAKPVNPQDLFAVMEDLLHKHPRQQEAHEPAHAAPSEVEFAAQRSTIQHSLPSEAPSAPAADGHDGQPSLPMDIEASLERAGDRAFWQLLLDTYFVEIEKRLGALASALRDGDAEIVQREAHSIKGASAEVLAEGVRNAAFELELAAKAGALSAAPVLLTVLEEEYARLKAHLAHPGVV